MIISALLWAACTSCLLLAVSGYAQMARTENGWREGPGWTAPLIFTSAAFALLTALGVLGLAGVLLAAVPLAVVTVKAARAWREIAKMDGASGSIATRTVLGLVGGRLRGALWNAREDVRDVTSRLRPARVPAAAAPAAPRAGGRRVKI